MYIYILAVVELLVIVSDWVAIIFFWGFKHSKLTFLCLNVNPYEMKTVFPKFYISGTMR